MTGFASLYQSITKHQYLTNQACKGKSQAHFGGLFYCPAFAGLF